MEVPYLYIPQGVPTLEFLTFRLVWFILWVKQYPSKNSKRMCILSLIPITFRSQTNYVHSLTKQKLESYSYPGQGSLSGSDDFTHSICWNIQACHKKLRWKLLFNSGFWQPQARPLAIFWRWFLPLTIIETCYRATLMLIYWMQKN